MSGTINDPLATLVGIVSLVQLDSLMNVILKTYSVCYATAKYENFVHAKLTTEIKHQLHFRFMQLALQRRQLHY